jgi:broad specificity phosphatase PhoE
MSTFYLVRHGQPDYNALSGHSFFGYGRDFAPLSPVGIKQAETASTDSRLHSAELIVSSPYTRALQTAQIISRHTGLPVQVELDLHEWIPDLTNTYTSSEESWILSKEFADYRGEYPEGITCRWETLSSMRKRMIAVADKYADCEKVIFVGHGMAFRTLTYIEELPPGGIVECHYEKGQPFCAYSFY